MKTCAVVSIFVLYLSATVIYTFDTLRVVHVVTVCFRVVIKRQYTPPVRPSGVNGRLAFRRAPGSARALLL